MPKLRKKILPPRLKKKDLERAVIRTLARSAWEKKKQGVTSERVHLNKKRKPLRHKKAAENQELE